MSNPTGHLVEFIEKNRVILGLVQSVKKNRLAILTVSDKQVTLPQNRTLLLTPAAISPERPRDAQVEYMREVEQRRESLCQKVEVEQLWELVHDEEEPLPLSDLAELSFGKPVDDDQQAATLRALFYERLHFRLAGGDYLPLSPEQLEQKVTQQQREAAHRAEVDQAVAWLKNLPPPGSSQDSPPAPEGLLEMLRCLLVFEDDYAQAKKAKEIISLAEIGGRKQLFNLLVSLGELQPDENLPLLRADLPLNFTPQVLDQAKKINPESALDSGREDLSGLYTFTIDGAFTTDFDDALSFEPDADGGGILGVHITDAAALLATEGILDQEAQERGATLYMPDLRIPMLPPSLSEDALSLREGVLRPCLSCLCRLSPEGEVMEYSLKRSVLKVHKRLTYEDADQMLQSDPRLAGLFSACKGLRSQRARAGAYFLPLPEVLVGVDDEGQVWVRRVDRDGPAREMVAETAILANQLKARFLVEHQIPNLYRTQPPPKEPIEEGDPEDLYLHFKQRRLLNPVDITVKPGRHSSLGIEPYTHATSPMRRYLDLVAQRQLGAALAERELPYNEEDLKCLAMKVEPIVRRGFKIRQARQRYWIIKWLAQKKDEAVPGIVMEYQLRRWQVLLTDVMLLTTIPNLPGLSLEPGQDVQLKIDRADPFYDIIKVSLA